MQATIQVKLSNAVRIAQGRKVTVKLLRRSMCTQVPPPPQNHLSSLLSSSSLHLLLLLHLLHHYIFLLLLLCSRSMASLRSVIPAQSKSVTTTNCAYSRDAKPRKIKTKPKSSTTHLLLLLQLLHLLHRQAKTR